MTPQERKEKTETYLAEIGIPINIGLPAIEGEDEVIIRTASEIAKRILILVYLGVYSEDGNKNEIIKFLKAEELWDSVSDYEKKLLKKKNLTDKDKINISWRSEGIYLMLWVINKIDELDLPDDQCDTSEIFDLLPNAFDSTKDFIQNAVIRTTKEILDKSDLIYRLHWATREAESKDEDIPADLDSSIMQEWHYAINWITYYDENWDDILTDT